MSQAGRGGMIIVKVMFLSVSLVRSYWKCYGKKIEFDSLLKFNNSILLSYLVFLSFLSFFFLSKSIFFSLSFLFFSHQVCDIRECILESYQRGNRERSEGCFKKLWLSPSGYPCEEALFLFFFFLDCILIFSCCVYFFLLCIFSDNQTKKGN